MWAWLGLVAFAALATLTALYVRHDPDTCSECARRRANRPAMHPTQGTRCPHCGAQMWDASAHAWYCPGATP